MQSKRLEAFTYIDLFSGIGGFRLALDAMGGRCVNFSEVSRDAIHAYCVNFEETDSLNLGDMTKLKELQPHDVLTAGVPCQSWSIAGRNLGFDDDRGQLWNDTLYLLKQSRPKAFIFENVKGLVDPRNQEALQLILSRIQQAGYFARHFVLTSSDYGVPQDRVRVYIVGFREERYLRRFELPKPRRCSLKLRDILQKTTQVFTGANTSVNLDLFGETVHDKRRHKKAGGMNDFFLFNDIRNGPTTIHSWDLKPTTKRQKEICLLMLRNRRKPVYGALDGNPLSLAHIQYLDKTIDVTELDSLVTLGILKTVPYSFDFDSASKNISILNSTEAIIVDRVTAGNTSIDSLRRCHELKIVKFDLNKIILRLIAQGVLQCTEFRYEFRYTKISTGIEGINRIFLPKSEAFPTLVASDTNDFIALRDVQSDTEEGFKTAFMQEIFHQGLFRKVSKQEACMIQGFPKNFRLPDSRSRWMKLIGNSVSVPVIKMLVAAMMETGCFNEAIDELDKGMLAGDPHAKSACFHTHSSTVATL